MHSACPPIRRSSTDGMLDENRPAATSPIRSESAPQITSTKPLTPVELASQQLTDFENLKLQYEVAETKQMTAFGTPKASSGIKFDWSTHKVEAVARDWTGEMHALLGQMRVLADALFKMGQAEPKAYVNKIDMAPKSPVIAPLPSPKPF
jgi:hypothetical protein